jgi:hypothetical protein
MIFFIDKIKYPGSGIKIRMAFRTGMPFLKFI